MKTRREFLQFIGATGIGLSSFGVLNTLTSCTAKSVFPTLEDNLVLRPGLSYRTLISWGDKMNQNDVFGFNNDYINYHAITNDVLILWVNHEYVNPLFVSSYDRTKENVDIEKSLVGGSLVKVKKCNEKNLRARFFFWISPKRNPKRKKVVIV